MPECVHPAGFDVGIFTENMAHDMKRMTISAHHNRCPDAEVLASPELFGEATLIPRDSGKA